MAKFYGETETEQEVGDMKVSREVVAEVMNFGVKESQIIHIIKLLALELENRDHMILLNKCIDDILEGKVVSAGPSVQNLVRN